MRIREIKPSEYGLLDDFLYEAVFQDETERSLPRSVINDPALRAYTAEFGHKEHDWCLCAQTGGDIAGAVWCRMIKGGYGYVDSDTPELAIALYRDYRNRGIGTNLMKAMLKFLKNKGYQKVSLSVHKKNSAFHLYQKLGFYIVTEDAQSCVMEYNIQDR